jgi:hypothetical protein
MSDRLAIRLGFWCSVMLAVLGAFYLALLIGFPTTQGFVFPPSPFVQLVGGIITLVTAPTVLVLFAAIKQTSPE